MLGSIEPGLWYNCNLQTNSPALIKCSSSGACGMHTICLPQEFSCCVAGGHHLSNVEFSGTNSPLLNYRGESCLHLANADPPPRKKPPMPLCGYINLWFALVLLHLVLFIIL